MGRGSRALGQRLIAVVDDLYEVGCITSTGGNVSARLPDDPEQILITPSHIFKGDLAPELLSRITLGGEKLDSAAEDPSSEWQLHVAIYRARPDVRAVVHAHPPQTTVLKLCGLPWLPISLEAGFLGELPEVPFIMPGTDELAQAAAEALGDGIAVFMQNHGLVVAATTLRRAADWVQIIERTAKLLVTCHLLGREPARISDEAVAELRQIGKSIA